MRIVLQRVKEAKVTSKGEVVGEIGKGLFILLGVGKDDKPEHADLLAEKVAKLRIMADPPSPKASEGQAKKSKMNLSVKDVDAEVLVVSQFTLYADTSGGNRPSFINAAPPELARELYERFVEQLRGKGVKVETGSFGDYMEIENTADGPVTITLKYPS